MIPPRNVADLQRELRRAASSNEEFAHWQVVMANVIAGQFLDGAVMRGGAALKLRYGDADTRYTMDFDASRSIDEAEFVDRYSERLAVGWNGFTGRIVRVKKPRPRNVPGQYVMQPFEIKLSYNNRPWCTVDFELSYNEVGDADRHDLVELPEEVLAIFRKRGLQEAYIKSRRSTNSSARLRSRMRRRWRNPLREKTDGESVRTKTLRLICSGCQRRCLRIGCI